MNSSQRSTGRSLAQQLFSILALFLMVILPLMNVASQTETAAAAGSPTSQAGQTGTGAASDTSTVQNTPVGTSTTVPSTVSQSSQPAQSGPTVPILVKFKGSARDTDKDAAINAIGGQSARDLKQIHTRVIDVPASQADQMVAAYGKHSAVEHAARAVKLTKASMPNDPDYAQQWALPKIGWDRAYGSVAIQGSAKIAVLDTGVDASHPDLSAVMTSGVSEIGGDPNSDPNGHGTELAGIAAATVNNATGMAGVAYGGASISSVQVLQSDGTGYDSDAVSGVLWAADNGANVILMGFSSPTYSSALADAVAYAQSKGVVVVAATGNDGSTAATYPAGLPGVVGVAATDQSDTLTSFSDTGSAAVAAPGVGIYATQPGGGYGEVSGTSPASAEVAGEAALLMASGDSASQASAQLTGATDPIPGHSFGRIDVAKALGAAVTPVATATPADTPTPAATAPVYTAAGNATVSGIVTDATTSAAIQGATVTCDTTNGCNGTFTITTDSAGHYSFQPNFSGSSHTISVTVSTSGYNTQTSATFTASTGNTYTKSFSLTPVSTPTTLSVSAATGTLGGNTGLSATLTANGSGVAGKTVSFTLNGKSAGTATTNASGVATLSNVSLSSTNAGTYTSGVQASFAGDTQYKGSSGSASLTVSKAALTVTAGSPTMTYAGQVPTVMPSYSGFLNGDTADTALTGSPSCSTTATSSSPVGNYASSCTQGTLAAADYTFTFVNGSVTVGKAALTVKVTASGTYGASPNLSGLPPASSAFTYTGFVNGDTVATAVGGTLTCSTTATSSSPAGTYPVSSCSGLTAGNYTISYDPSSSYQVTGAALTVKVTASGSYGSSPSLAGVAPTDARITYSGFVGSDNESNAVSGKLTCSTAATSTSSVGSYSVSSCSGLTTTSYTVTYDYTHSSYQVTPAILTVTAGSPSMTYGGQVPAVAASYSGFVNGDTAATALTGSPSCSTTATGSSPVGAYSSSCTPGTLAAANYTFGFANGTLHVNPATLTVTADNKSKTYGDPNPSFTATYSGFKNGDTSAVLSGSPSLTTAVATVSSVGSYTVTAAQGTLAAANYTFNFVNGTFTVNTRPATITADNKSMTFGGSVPSFTFQTSGLVNADGLTTNPTCGAKDSNNHAVSSSAPAGSYTINCSGASAGSNYTISYASGTLTVGQAQLTVSCDNKSMTYGGTVPALTYTVSGYQNGDSASVISGTPTCSTAATSSSPAGSYGITANVSGLSAANYTFQGTNGQLTIGPAVLTVSADNKSMTYGDSTAPGFTVSYSGFVNGDNSGVVSGPVNCAAKTSGSTVNVDSSTPAGSYTIDCSGSQLSAANYTLSYKTGTLSVGKAQLTVQPDNQSRVYGASNPAFTYGFTGFRNNDPQSVVSGMASCSSTATSSSPVAVYSIACDVSGLSAANYTFTSGTGTLTVTPATLHVVADDQSMTYGSSVPSLTYHFQTSGFVNGDTSAAVSGSASCTTTATSTSPAGSYDVTCQQGTLSATNYTFAFVKGTLTVGKATITVTPEDQSRTYGAANPTFTYRYSGFQNGDTASVVNGTPSCSTSATASSAVGSYPITCDVSGLSSTNYAFTSGTGTLTVSQAALVVTPDNKSRVYGDANPTLTGTVTGVQNGDNITASYSTTANASSAVGTYDITATLSDPDTKLGNYSVTLNKGTLTITKAPLSVKADDQSRVYGDTNPTFTGALTGVFNNDGITASYSTSASQSSPVGTYPITPSLNDPNHRLGNYSVSSTNGTLTVTQAPLTITADDQTKTYGDPNPTLTGKITGLKNNDGITATYSTAATASSPAGTYAIVPAAVDSTPSTLNNYSVTLVNGTLTVGKASLTVTANDASKVYGQDTPSFTVSYQGFVNGDTASSLGGTLSFSTSATNGSDVGSYEVTPSGLTSANYALTFVKGTLTVTQAPLTVTADDKSKVYGSDNPAFTVSYQGFVLGQDPTALGSTLSFSTSATASSPVGSYAITPSGLTSGNYAINFVPGTLTVTPAPLTITADNQSRTYGDPNPTLTGSITGLQNADKITTTYSTTATQSSPVGSYDIVPAAVDTTPSLLGNYSVTLSKGTLTVTAAPLTVTPTGATRVYGAANPSFTGQIVGLKNNDNITASYSSSANASSSVGSYDITATLSDPDTKLGNYSVTLNKGTLTVTKAPLTVKADDQSRTYGDPNPTFTGTLTGVLNNDGITASYDSSAMPASAVSTYDIVPTLGDPNNKLSNYSVTSTNGTLTVTPALLTITANDKTRVYGATNPNLDGSITGIKNSDTITASYSTQATPASSIGTYAIVPAAVDSSPSTLGNYSVKLVNGTLTITKAPLSVKPDDQSRVYGDPNPTLTGTVTGILNNDGISASYSTPATAASSVGTYPITDTPNDPNHKLGNYSVSSTNGTLTVTPAPLTITADDQTKTYGQDNPALTGKITGLKNSDGITASYGTAATASSPAGAYAIVPAAVDSTPSTLGNYSLTLVNGTITVGKAALTITTNPATKVYGQANPAFTVSYSGFVNGDTASSLGGTLGFDTSATTGSDVGSYDVTPSGLTSANYVLTFVKGTLTVTLAPLTVTANDVSKVYGQANPSFSVKESGFVLGQDASVLTGTLTYTTAADASSSVGSYAITPSGLSSTNYAINFVPGTLTITPAPLTITADNQSRTYGDPNPTLTGSITGLQNADKITATYSTTATQSSPVGPYPITATLSDTDSKLGNYSVTNNGNTLTVTAAPLSVKADDKSKVYGAANRSFTGQIVGLKNNDAITASYSTSADASSPVGTYPIVPTLSGAALSNYQTPVVTNGTLTVTPAPLSATADKKSKVYGQANPAFTVSYGGFVNNDGPSSLGGTLSFATSATATSHVGSYAITPSGLTSSNYTISYVTGTLSVTPAALTITADSKSMLYGGNLPTLTTTFTGLVNGDTPATFSAAPNMAPTPSTVSASSHAGSYAITVSGAQDADYSITFVNGTLTISPAALTVSADSKSKVYGANLPTLTASYSGFVNGDTSASLTTQPTPTTPATAGSHVGSYSITASGAKDADYTIGYVAGTLTVTPAALTITADNKAMVYGGALPALTVIYSGLVNGDTPATFSTAPNTAPSCSTVPASTPVGSYAITCAGAVDADYSISYGKGTLAITTAQLTVTPANQTKLYLAANPTLTGTITGIQNGDTITATYSTTATQSSPVGSYPITATLSDPGNKLGNYSVTLNQGTLTIVYRFDGFLQPINDTAHQTTCGSPCPQSIFNAGATVPVKFQTKDVNGNPVGPDASLPTFQAQQVGSTNAAVDETSATVTATIGSTFQWDGTSQQYIYNWKTSKSMSGQQWQITAKLADGQVFTVTIGLK